MAWGVGAFHPAKNQPVPQNGMGGPSERPISSFLEMPPLDLTNSFLKSPSCKALPSHLMGPVNRPGNGPTEMKILRGQTFYEALAAQKVGHEDIMALVKACKDFRNLRTVRAGEIFRIEIKEDGGLEALGFDLDEESYVTFVRKGDTYERIDGTYPVERHLKALRGTINHSLYVSLQELGAPLALAPKMNDILGWDIDFNRDLRKGDTFCILFEEVYKEDQLVRTGSILGVQIMNRGKLREAFRFTSADGRQHYYNADGNNLQKQLLRAPVEYSRVSSKFSNRRFHPVLKRWMPHHGVDYAAPLGTPVRAGGDGVVVACTSKKGNGRYIQIRHTNAEYQTYYLHLSRYAKGIRKGSQVDQGQIIGYVGATGYATGPHLDYRVKRSGTFVNPRSLKLPAAAPVDKALMDDFKSKAQVYVSLLESVELGAQPVVIPPLQIADIENWKGPIVTSVSLPEFVGAH
ncbi:MAG: peptidoglycan DD-metalloendopeptidase family protein [bacterium]|nr:peptidoglycan DD-metalloendopeptidase family protein [bacterium]